MAVRYLNLLGTPNQIEDTKKIISDFNLKGTILNELSIRQGLFTIEIKVEGDKMQIKKLVEHFQNTN
jgi:alkyl sulfatase BDS1-like metallo-beta-lactamase superfamily hydrolase